MQKRFFHIRLILSSLMVLFGLFAYGQNDLPLGDNLVINGAFEQGHMGFSTDYQDDNVYPAAGEYCIDNNASGHYQGSSNPQPWLGTGHSGKHMIVNGSGSANDIVWHQEIDVTENTEYVFSIWVSHIYKGVNDYHKAMLKFYINGIALNNEPFINDIQNSNNRPNWRLFTANWNSGNSTTAEISIYDINDNPDAGNDFGLDDISFRQRLAVGSIPRLTPICEGSTLELTPPDCCNDCSGQWEVLQGDSIIYTTNSNTMQNVPISWDGCFLRYAVNYQNEWYYSNAVQIYVTQNPNVQIQIIDGSSPLCDGDTAILHAVVDDVMFNFISVGDILCTDGSIVHASNWSDSGKTAKGIVFYVDSTDVHGWALGLVEMSVVQWSKNDGSIQGLNNISNVREALGDFNGKENTELISTDQYPAAWFCVSNGGYLPSIGQLNILFGGLAEVNASIFTVEGTAIPSSSGWFMLSSTVQTDNDVYYIDRSGNVQSGDKTYSGTWSAPRVARPIYDF